MFKHLTLSLVCALLSFTAPIKAQEKIIVTNIESEGSGCAQGSVGSKLIWSRGIELLLENYTAVNNKTIDCKVTVDFTVPDGRYIDGVEYSYDGFRNISSGGGLMLSNHYQFIDLEDSSKKSQRYGGAQGYWGSIGPIYSSGNSFEYSDTSSCGGKVRIIYDSTIEGFENINQFNIDSVNIAFNIEECTPKKTFEPTCSVELDHWGNSNEVCDG